MPYPKLEPDQLAAAVEHIQETLTRIGVTGASVSVVEYGGTQISVDHKDRPREHYDAYRSDAGTPCTIGRERKHPARGFVAPNKKRCRSERNEPRSGTA